MHHQCAASSVGSSVVSYPLDRLKPHPLQAGLFADLPDVEIERLAEDLRRHGQQCPIEVLRDGTIVCGHQRVRAARMLGWEEIDAVVRADLEDKGAPYVAARLIADNALRRQLTPLDQARCYRQLKQQAGRMEREDADQYRGMDYRDVLARQFGMSGRHLDRLVRILKTPMAVQNAVSGNRLSLKAAGKVAGLKEPQQKEVARRIAAGEEPEQVVADYVTKGTGRHRKAAVACKAFVRGLRRGLADLDGRLVELKSVSAADAGVLREGLQVIEQILQQARVVGPVEMARADAELRERLPGLRAARSQAREAAGHGVRAARSQAPQAAGHGVRAAV
jgi:ParB family chromosome partitioning protein